MKLNHSLKQAWLLIIFVAVILPSISIMIWYGVSIYNAKLNTAITIKKYENEILAHDFEAEIQRLKAIIENKSDALAIQIENLNAPESYKS